MELSIDTGQATAPSNNPFCLCGSKSCQDCYPPE